MARFLALFALVLLSSLGAAQGSSKLWWVFLSTGPNHSPVSKDQDKVEQAMHLANHAQLYNRGKSVMAGTIKEGKDLVEAVVVNAKDRDAVNDLFHDDPLVAGGRLTVNAFPWKPTAELRKVHAQKEISIEMNEYLLVTLSAANSLWGGSFSEAAVRAISHWPGVSIAGKVSDPQGPLRAVVIFRMLDRKTVAGMMGKLSQVKNGQLEVQMVPFFTAAGILD